MFTLDTNLRVLCVNGDCFAHHPNKLLSFSPKVFSNKRFLNLLQYLKEPRAFDEVSKFIINNKDLKEYTPKRILDLLIEKGFIRIYDNSLAHEKVWKDNNWHEALFFHLHTNNLPKVMYNTENGNKDDIMLMEQYVDKETPPSNYKIREGTHTYLEKPELDLTYKAKDVLTRKNKLIKLDHILLSRLLYYAFGQIGVRAMKVTGNHVRKTVPSGGARHPIEAYLIILDVPKLDSGIYHYNVKDHALTLIKSINYTDAQEIIKRNLLLDNNRPGFDFKIAIIYSCMFSRSMFRYRESRSYRVMQFDIGHLTQNLSFLSKAYGLNLYSAYSCHEKELENMLGLDSYTESIMGYSVL